MAAGDDVESGVCEFAGEELAGVELCAHIATLPKSNTIRKQLRIRYFTALRSYSFKTYLFKPAIQTWVARNACRHLRAVSSSGNRLPSCSTR